MTTLAWDRYAECQWEDAELHFPVGNTGPALLQIEEAKTVCRRCPVVQECLSEAMRLEGSAGRDSRHGIRGGLTSDERHALYRREVKRRYNQHRQQQAVNA